MELSYITAKIISILYVSIGLGLLIGRFNFRKLAEDLKKSPGLTFIIGIADVIFGVVLVQYHNIWLWNWVVLVTITGWGLLIGGIILIIFPNCIKIPEMLFKNTIMWGVFALVVGIIFGYFGFFT